MTLALTHRSHGSQNNERLEFLGDAVLGYVVSEWLFRDFTSARESDLTLMRASLVQRRTLSIVARELDLGAEVRLGAGERASGGHARESILADTFEAIVGSILLDAGIEAARAVIERLFAAHRSDVGATLAKDAKTELQEWLQARGFDLPRYRVAVQSGDAHAPRFEVVCSVAALGVEASGEGGNRRDAEKASARLALERLKVQNA